MSTTFDPAAIEAALGHYLDPNTRQTWADSRVLRGVTATPSGVQVTAELGYPSGGYEADLRRVRVAIGGLLAMTREDWHLAIELLNDLITIQGDRTQPMTCQMLARALACNLNLPEAKDVLEQALKVWPQDPVLLAEYEDIKKAPVVSVASSSFKQN